MRHPAALMLVLLFGVLLRASPAWAEDHSHHGHEEPAPQAPAAVDHSTMDHGQMDHSTMDHGQMDHGAAKETDHTQHSTAGDSTLRDPHAYSNGYTLHSGPYVLANAKHMHAGDTANFHALSFDRFEMLRADGESAGHFDGEFWFGNTYDRFVIKSEGEITNGQIEDSSTRLLWRHATTAFWDLESGIRIDSGGGSDNTWLSLGLAGLMPYWIETDVALQLREDGLVGLNGEFEYAMRFTNRLIAEPSLAFNIYSENRVQEGFESGLSDLTLGLRLRYEITRQFAPYIGVEWQARFGANTDARETSIVAGLRFWF